jgi:hypothetical protein
LLTYRGVRSWPPIWHCLGDGLDRHPKGEVGILREVKVPLLTPFNRCFLVIEYKTNSYMGCIFTNDVVFSTGLGSFLQSHCGESIEQIGSLDMDHTL